MGVTPPATPPPGPRPPRAPPPADETAAGRWYGWQLLLADAAATALLFAPVSDQVGPLARGMGMTVLLMDAPVAHMAHRNGRSASISLLRLPGLLLGRLLGTALGSVACTDVSCTHMVPLLGSAVGIAPVMIYDWLSARPPGRLFYAHAARPERALPSRRALPA